VDLVKIFEEEYEQKHAQTGKIEQVHDAESGRISASLVPTFTAFGFGRSPTSSDKAMKRYARTPREKKRSAGSPILFTHGIRCAKCWATANTAYAG
jgi:hypothetical protein